MCVEGSESSPWSESAAHGLVDAAEATGHPHALSFALLAYGFAFVDADPGRALEALRRGSSDSSRQRQPRQRIPFGGQHRIKRDVHTAPLGPPAFDGDTHDQRHIADDKLLRQRELTHIDQAAAEQARAADQVLHVAVVDLLGLDGDGFVLVRLQRRRPVVERPG